MKKNIHTTPTSMNMDVMRDIVLPLMASSPSFYYSNEIYVSAGVEFFNKILELTDGGPFLIEDYRLGMLVRGEIDITVNLIDYHVTAGQMIYLGRGSIVHVHRVSQNTIVKGFVISSDLVSQSLSGTQLSLLGSSTAFYHNSLTDDHKFLDNIIQSVWALVHTPDYSRPVLRALVLTVLTFYDHLYQVTSAHPHRDNNLFNQFVALVNKHSDHERSIPFYADQLCLSPRYFSTLIMEQSGKSAKHWIDAAVMERAKILLRHSPLTVSQISAELNFPNDSFFCKFFRRLAGCSPSEYRNS